MMNKNYYCVIMAGGVGSRFWPISRNSLPKQFLDILGTGRSFIQQTYDRMSQIVAPENILVVTSQQYGDLVKEHLPEIPQENILLEPYRRNTAPCIAYAASKIYYKNQNATMVITPSDHYITNETLYLKTISAALDHAVTHDDLFTLGIQPTRPETAYGYIQKEMNDSKNINGHIAYNVKTFTEKPSHEMAKVLVDSGEFLWNSGIFIWNVKSIKREMESCLPEVANFFSMGDKYYYTDKEEAYIHTIYTDCPSISIDYGVMEKTSKAWVFEASFGWSDLGTWESLYMHAQKDEHQNYISCDDLMMDKMTGSIIMNTEKEKLLAIKGLDNFMIVNTPDVLMICPRDPVRFKNMMTDLTVHDKTRYQ